MRAYLAARYTRHGELQQYVAQLEGRGHTVTSEWLKQPYETTDNGATMDGVAVDLAEEAWRDLLNINAADTFILFADEPDIKVRGGRLVEFGVAIALSVISSLRLVVIGRRETLFHYLPSVEVYETWEQFLRIVPALCQEIPKELIG